LRRRFPRPRRNRPAPSAGRDGCCPSGRRRGSASRKPAGGMDRSPSRSTFAAACQAGVAQRIGWGRACKTTHRTRKDRLPPGRRRCAPEVWVGDGAPTLPIGTMGDAQCARCAGGPIEENCWGWIAVGVRLLRPGAVSVIQLIELEKTGVRAVDGAARLGLRPTRRSALHGERWDAERARSAVAPFGKTAGGMTSVSSDFCRAPARPCNTTHRT